MELREQVYDIDDLWALYHQPENEGLRFELIDGVLFEMSAPGGDHGEYALNLGSYIRAFGREHGLGRATVGTGYHPHDDRRTLLVPDVAFISHTRAPKPFPKKLVPVMPDIAVEIRSPSNTLAELRSKARLYLELGTTLVWLVLPDDQSVEVCRLAQSGKMEREVFGQNETLSGDAVLPGFTLRVRLIFE